LSRFIEPTYTKETDGTAKKIIYGKNESHSEGDEEGQTDFYTYVSPSLTTILRYAINPLSLNSDLIYLDKLNAGRSFSSDFLCKALKIPYADIICHPYTKKCINACSGIMMYSLMHKKNDFYLTSKVTDYCLNNLLQFKHVLKSEKPEVAYTEFIEKMYHEPWYSFITSQWKWFSARNSSEFYTDLAVKAPFIALIGYKAYNLYQSYNLQNTNRNI
jgi:hypothetical protein